MLNLKFGTIIALITVSNIENSRRGFRNKNHPERKIYINI